MSDRDNTIGADRTRTHSIGRAGRWTRRQALTAMGAGAALPLAVGVAGAKKPEEYEVEEVVSFPDTDLPEAITVDRRGNKYLTFPLLGEIRDVPPRGTEASEFASGLSPVLLGIAATPPGDLYTVSTEFGGGSRAVYRVSRDGEVETLETFDASSGPEFLNGIVAEGDRWLISDSWGGAVWSFADGVAEEWVTSELLTPDGGTPPIGANGVALDRNGDLYVSNSDKQHIVRVPIEPDGSAGTPEVWAEDDRLQGADGIRFDTRENLYVAVNDQHAIVRLAEEKSGDVTVETIASEADGDPLDFPSDLAFGTARGEQTTLFVVNFAFAPVDENDPKPGLAKIDVGVPGLPINR